MVLDCIDSLSLPSFLLRMDRSLSHIIYILDVSSFKRNHNAYLETSVDRYVQIISGSNNKLYHNYPIRNVRTSFRKYTNICMYMLLPKGTSLNQNTLTQGWLLKKV